MDAFLNALADEPFRMGATFAVLFSALILVGAFLLNKWQRWWVSADLLAMEKAHAEEAKADAAEAVARAHAEAAARAQQDRADRQAELDRLIRFADALQRDVDGWKTAWNLADQANREEDDAQWNEIRAFMAQATAALTVIQRFITELQRQAFSPPLELEAGNDGGARVV